MQHYVAICLTLLAFATISFASAQERFPSPPEGRAAFVDIEFAYLAARLHNGGIEICRLEEGRGDSAAIKALAAKIRDGQEHVRPVLIQHAKSAAKNPAIALIDKQLLDAHSKAVARLQAARGSAVDREFVREIIRLHDAMLQLLERSRISDPALKTLATRIGVEHSRELEELKRLQSQ